MEGAGGGGGGYLHPRCISLIGLSHNEYLPASKAVAKLNNLKIPTKFKCAGRFFPFWAGY